MRILVTGGTGFIGRRVCADLTGAGHQVSLLSRSAEGARKSVPEAEQAFTWNPMQGAPPEESLAGQEAILHLAGESVVGRWSATKRRAIRESRVVGTRHLVEGIDKSGQPPSLLIAASAIGYYGDRGEEPLTEQSAPGEDFLAQVCEEWEEEALAARELGLRVVCLRTGIVLGPGGGALQAMLLPFKMGVGGPLGSGRQWWSWIHREDMAGIIRFCLENSLEGPVNATAPEPARQKDFARALGKVLRRPAFLPAPALALKVVLGGFSSELLSSKRVQPARLQKSGYQFRFPELEGALRDACG